MDQEDQQHRLRGRELPTEPRMGQLRYLHQKLGVSPDEVLRLEVETSMKYVKIGCVSYRIFYVFSLPI